MSTFQEEIDTAYEKWFAEGYFYNPANNMTPRDMSKQSPSGRAAGAGSATSQLKKTPGGLPLPPKV